MGPLEFVWRQGDGEDLGHGADLVQLRHATGATDVRLNDADCVLLQHVAEFLTGVELLAGGYGHVHRAREGAHSFGIVVEDASGTPDIESGPAIDGNVDEGPHRFADRRHLVDAALHTSGVITPPPPEG